jgi:uncharacterized protein YbjQ (UPF0145 family)
MSVQDPMALGIPPKAIERLRSMAQPQTRFFTSDLSANEFLLVKEAGFDPMGLVVGSSIYHVGWQNKGWNQNQEVQVLSQAMYNARELAMSRMEAEADALGADGVVGVRLDINAYTWGEGLLEFIAMGSAVKSREGSHRTVTGKPFTSDLSGQDFWAVVQAGYMPLALVMGTCVYHVAHQSLGGWMRSIGQNVEMPNFTQALYDARELAMERMQAEAKQVQAEGIVAAQIQEKSRGWGAHVIEFFALGTAVKSVKTDHQITKPTMVLPLSVQPPSIMSIGSVL